MKALRSDPERPVSIIAGVEAPKRPTATREFLGGLVKGLDSSGAAGGFIAPVALDEVEHEIVFAFEFSRWKLPMPGPEDRRRHELYRAVRAAAEAVLARPLSDFEEAV